MKSFKTKAGTELPLLDLRGMDYLQVAHRIVWFREERPHDRIETEIHTLTDGFCIMKAMVRDGKGDVIAMAHKREDQKSFADYMEKAETGAIGRALAQLGYGTQFAPDMVEGDRLADSPIPPKPPLVNHARKQTEATKNAESKLSSAPQQEQKQAIEEAPWRSPQEVPWDDEPPTHCEVCKMKLVTSKKNGSLYCPDFQKKELGNHTYWKAE